MRILLGIISIVLLIGSVLAESLPMAGLSMAGIAFLILTRPH